MANHPAGPGGEGDITGRTANRPWGLRVAALLLAAQGLAPITFALWMVVRHTNEAPSNEDVYTGSAVALIVLGVMVLAVAAAMWSAHGWSFGGGVFIQLLCLAISYEMVRAEFWQGAIPLGLSAVATLGMLFSAPVRAALGRGQDDASESRPSRS